MIDDVIVGGVFLAPILRYIVLAIVAVFVVRPLLALTRLDRLIWNKPLFELGLFGLFLSLFYFNSDRLAALI
ncbi:DUF1656 domain-containing protein [Radicibacter daui]|uniref:DUF1656 domain-containing protein n=1 Tax=Radicibacter daui TaxID=3064829 RepID=UPI004046B161